MDKSRKLSFLEDFDYQGKRVFAQTSLVQRGDAHVQMATINMSTSSIARGRILFEVVRDARGGSSKCNGAPESEPVPESAMGSVSFILALLRVVFGQNFLFGPWNLVPPTS